MTGSCFFSLIIDRTISDSDVNPRQNADTGHFKIPTSDLGHPPLPVRASAQFILIFEIK